MHAAPPPWICRRTYLEWAERNLRLNGLTGQCASPDSGRLPGVLREANEQFDLIFIDPPTFSNSKRMEDAFDVQRDHLALMKDLKRLLRAGGRSCSRTTNVASVWISTAGKTGTESTRNYAKNALPGFRP